MTPRIPLPDLGDLDGDGDLDVIVGDTSGHLAYIRNDEGLYFQKSTLTGAEQDEGIPQAIIEPYSYEPPISMQFPSPLEIQEVVYPLVNPLSITQFDFGITTPTFVDLDGDDDLDLFIKNNTLHYFENTGSTYTSTMRMA